MHSMHGLRHAKSGKLACKPVRYHAVYAIECVLPSCPLLPLVDMASYTDRSIFGSKAEMHVRGVTKDAADTPTTKGGNNDAIQFSIVAVASRRARQQICGHPHFDRAHHAGLGICRGRLWCND